jgi:hypothetical protein
MHALNAFTNHPANCTVTLDKFGFKIIDPNFQILCEGEKDENDKLWFMPSNIQTPTVNFASANIFVKHEPNAIFVAYQSACFLNPPDSTLEIAAQKGYLGNLPRLTAKMIRDNKPNSIGTAHGHLNRLRQNIRSTKIDPDKKNKDKKILNKQTITNTNTSMPNSNIVKESTGEQDEKEMVTKTIQMSDLSPEERKALAVYHDATGRFPFQSEEGYEYMLVSVYKNYIHVEPMIDRRAPSYVTAYRSAIKFFQSKGHIVSVNRLDNESSILLENFFNEEVKMEFNFIGAGNHRANKAERAIQSWKNHFIAGIATVDPDFPMTQWPKFLVQAELTLNHLRPFADNDKISAYEGIYKSKYDFKAHPIAPIGTKVVVYEPSDQRTSWSPHGIQGFYLGPALKHYRSVAVYIPNTNGIRISDQCQYFPKPFMYPGASTNEILLNSVTDLKNAINNNENVIENTKLIEAIDKLDNAIEKFKENEIPPKPQSPDGNEIDQIAIASSLPDVPNNTLKDTPSFPDFPNNTIEKIPEVIDNEPNYTSKRVLYDKHHLRSTKDKKSKNEKYRKLTPQESKTDYYKRLKERIGQHWIDKETKEEFVINTVVMPTKLTGKGSKTAYYSFFNISQHSLPTLKRYLQYTPCHEINTGKYVTWIQRGNSAFACSIRSNNPKDPNRGLNQTKEGQPLNFRKAMKLDPELWLKADEEEWHRLLENTLIPIKRNIIPPNESITYYNKQIKEKLVTIDDKNYVDARVRGTLGGDRTNYEGKTSTHTAEYPFIKILFSAVLHDVKHIDPNTRFVNIDMTDFYLKSPMEEPAYIAVPFKDIPDSIIKQYNLKQTATNEKAYFKVMMTMYGHPVSGYLSNKHLFKTIEPEGYYEDAMVPCMLKHKTRSTIGAIVVDDIGLKVRSNDDVLHLVNAIEKVWKVKINWQGNRYVGMDLKWDYNPEDPTLDISCDQIIPDALKRFYPNKILKGADTPGIEIKGWTLGSDNKVTTVEEEIPIEMPEMTKFVQQYTGTLSHASRIVRHDLLPAVNDIASTQSAPNSKTMKQIDRLSNYIARFPKASVTFKATDMITKAMYDSALRPHGKHKTGAIIYHSNKDDPPEKIGNITEVLCKLPRDVVASIAEGEYCSQFLTGQTAYWHRVINERMGYPQPPTILYGDNTTAIGIATDSIKVKKSKAMDKNLHWIKDRTRLGDFLPMYIPTEKNSADYQTKNLAVKEHNRQVRNYVKFPPPNLENPSLKPSVRKKVKFSERVY